MISQLNFNDIFFEFLWAYKLKVYEQKNENQQRTERRNSTEVKTLIKVSCESTFVLDCSFFQPECLNSCQNLRVENPRIC